MAKDPNQRFATPDAMAEALSPWTQTPIPPPSVAEMPQLSRAAMGLGPTDSNGPGSGPASSCGAPSPSPRKVWQVAGATPSAIAPAGREASPSPGPVPAVAEPLADSPSSQPPTRETRTDTSSLANQLAATNGSLKRTPASRPVVKTFARPAAAALPRPRPAPAVGEEELADDEDSPSFGKLTADTVDTRARGDTAPGTRRRPPSSTPRRIATPPPPHPLVKPTWLWWAVAGAAAATLLLVVLLWWMLSTSRSRSAALSSPGAAFASRARDGGGTRD
jgi:hypothetical protein